MNKSAFAAIAMRNLVIGCRCSLFWPHPTASQHSPLAPQAQKPPLLDASIVAALDQELSGETAKRNLEGITRFHRMRASRGFRDAAEFVAERARAYGLSDVTILSFPADGKTFYGTQKSRLAWDADFAELWEMREQDSGKWNPADAARELGCHAHHARRRQRKRRRDRRPN